jgi:hypothetical protein
MTCQARTPFTTDRLLALAEKTRLLVFALLVELAEALALFGWGRALRRQLCTDSHMLTRGAAAILALLALKRMPATLDIRSHARPAAAPHGFRCARPDYGMRFARRLLPRARTLRERLAAVARVLDDVEAWVVRMVAHLKKRPAMRAFLLACAITERCVAVNAPTCAGADTS